MLNLLARMRRVAQELTAAPCRLHIDTVGREFIETDDAPNVDSVRQEWLEIYHAQGAALEQVTAMLEDQVAIVNEARRFMTILAQRQPDGNSLFLINQGARPGEADTLRHAVVSLQAMLDGTELPSFVAVDRVTH